MATEIREFSFEQDRALCRQAEAAAYCDKNGVEEVDDGEVNKALARIQTHLESSSYHGFTVLEDGVPVGLIFADSDFPEAQAFIDNIYVVPSHRRREIGSHLVERVFDLLKERGIRHVDLMVTASSEPAIQLYKSLGFEVTRLRMAKKLDT
ncbi:MAG: ribosomal protein S18 acetylase RimI-like enzyme [Planctomycetota bacterium]|jgi:ribosomal protein S18 acetylase RimI-like enzyme